MANIKSAKKRVETNRVKYARNRAHKSELATYIKKFKALCYANNVEEAEKAYPITVSVIQSAASKGIIHKNNAANKVSAVTILFNNLKAGKIEAVVDSKKKKKS